MDLVASVLAALLTLHPGGTEATRRDAVEGIVAAATEAPLWPAAPGDDAHAEVLATALVLAAIGQHESSFDPRVGDCHVRGGGAISYYQLLGRFSYHGHEESEICRSPALAAKLALRLLHLHKTRCKRCAPAAWLAAYASGDPAKPSRASKATARLVDRLAKTSHVVLNVQADRVPVWERGFPREDERP